MTKGKRKMRKKNIAGHNKELQKGVKAKTS